MPYATIDVLSEVNKERIEQDRKWGEQNHDLTVWMTVLMEEVGEAAAEILHSREQPENDKWFIEKARYELLQCAAVAVAAVEYIDRKNGPRQ